MGETTFEEWYETNRHEGWEWRLPRAVLTSEQLQLVREVCRRAAMTGWHDGRREGARSSRQAALLARTLGRPPKFPDYVPPGED